MSIYLNVVLKESGSNTRSCTYSRPSGGSEPSYTMPPKTYTFDRMEPGSLMTREIAQGIIVGIQPDRLLTNVDVRVSRIAEKPAGVGEPPEGKVYEYLEMNFSGITSEDVQEAFVEFIIRNKYMSSVTTGYFGFPSSHTSMTGRLFLSFPT